MIPVLGEDQAPLPESLGLPLRSTKMTGRHQVPPSLRFLYPMVWDPTPSRPIRPSAIYLATVFSALFSRLSVLQTQKMSNQRVCVFQLSHLTPLLGQFLLPRISCGPRHCFRSESGPVVSPSLNGELQKNRRHVSVIFASISKDKIVFISILSPLLNCHSWPFWERTFKRNCVYLFRSDLLSQNRREHLDTL